MPLPLRLPTQSQTANLLPYESPCLPVHLNQATTAVRSSKMTSQNPLKWGSWFVAMLNDNKVAEKRHNKGGKALRLRKGCSEGGRPQVKIKWFHCRELGKPIWLRENLSWMSQTHRTILPKLFIIHYHRLRIPWRTHEQVISEDTEKCRSLLNYWICKSPQ